MTTLKRSLGLVQLTIFGVGSIVGAGVYSVIGIAAGQVGIHLWISFLGASLAGFLTVLSYAELSSFLTKAGAEYQFIKAAFPKWPVFAFMGGFLIALNASATAATVSLAFAGYLKVFISTPMFLTAFGLLSICTLINIAGIRESSWVTIILTCIEVGGLLLIIIGSFIKGDVSKAFATAPTIENFWSIIESSALIFFIYIGFEDVVNLSEETKDASRTIPRALLASTVITSAIYVLVALAVISISTPQELALSKSPLTTVANRIGPWMGNVVSVAALVATASTALIALVSISRMLFGMGRDGYMPKMFTSLLGRRRTPWIAALALFIASSLLLFVGEIKIVASVSSFGVLIVFIGIHLSVIVLRFSRPATTRPFHIPLSVGKLPLFPVFGILLMLAPITQFDLLVYAIVIGAIIVALIFYYLQRYFFSRSH